MKRNNKGIAEVALLLWIVVGMFALFVPNPISKAVGIGVQPNKTVERVELIKDNQGCPIAYKTTVTDQQQHVTWWQSLMALPRLWLLLMFAGLFFTPLAGLMTWVNGGLKKGIKQIVTGVEEAKKSLPKEAIETLDVNLSRKMDSPIKAEVKKIKVGL